MVGMSERNDLRGHGPALIERRMPAWATTLLSC